MGFEACGVEGEKCDMEPDSDAIMVLLGICDEEDVEAAGGSITEAALTLFCVDEDVGFLFLLRAFGLCSDCSDTSEASPSSSSKDS